MIRLLLLIGFWSAATSTLFATHREAAISFCEDAQNRCVYNPETDCLKIKRTRPRPFFQRLLRRRRIETEPRPLSQILDSLYEKVPALTRLNLSNNNLTALPPGIEKLRKLQILDLTNNPNLIFLPLPHSMLDRSPQLASLYANNRTPASLAQAVRRWNVPIQFEEFNVPIVPVTHQEALTNQRESIQKKWWDFSIRHREILWAILTPTYLISNEFSTISLEMEAFLNHKLVSYTKEKKRLFARLNTRKNKKALKKIARIILPKREKFLAKYPTLLQFNTVHAERKTYFHFYTALRGLKLLNGHKSMPHHSRSMRESYQTYRYADNMPTNLQLFILAYKIAMTDMDQKQAHKFVSAWLVEKYNSEEKIEKFHRMFLSLYQEDMGQVLASLEGQRFVQVVASYTRGEESSIRSTAINEQTIRSAMKIASMIRREWVHQGLTPLVEALKMTMRGHNRHLNRKKEPDSPACAYGSYLHMLNAVYEIARNRGDLLSLPGVEILECR